MAKRLQVGGYVKGAPRLRIGQVMDFSSHGAAVTTLASRLSHRYRPDNLKYPVIQILPVRSKVEHLKSPSPIGIVPFGYNPGSEH